MLDKDVQNHLGRQLRALYQGLADERPRALGKPQASAASLKPKAPSSERP